MIIHLPHLFGRGALAVHPRLLLVSRKALRLRDDEADALLFRHEAVHQNQMRRDRWSRWVVRYLFTGYWRARYEMEAHREDLAFYVARRVDRQRAAEAIVDLVRRRYFPEWWFGRAPAADVMLEWLLEDSARKAEA